MWSERVNRKDVDAKLRWSSDQDFAALYEYEGEDVSVRRPYPLMIELSATKCGW